jgi:hypothetical protein
MNERIIKSGFMIKRSQNKKISSIIINYRKRYFELTRNYLSYYDNEISINSNKEVRKWLF